MRDSEHPDLFPMQERKAVDVYAHRVARNSVLSDVAAVAAADALAGRPAPREDRTVDDEEAALPSALAAPSDGHGEEDHAGEDEDGQQQGRHDRGVPGRVAG